MTDKTTSVRTPSSSPATKELRTFFTRLAAGDYNNLAKELGISGRPTTPIIPTHGRDLDAFAEDSGSSTLNTSIESIDPDESFKFQATAEGLHRAVTLLRGDDPCPPTPEEEEAFQFTFRLMIHKLYSITDFASMVDDVVRTSQERYRPLSPELMTRRRESMSFSFLYHDDDNDSVTSLGMMTDASSLLPSPSSPTSSICTPPSVTDYCGTREEARVVKKRIVGRRLSVVEGRDENESVGDPSWVYNATVASVESPLSYLEEPFSPAGTSSPFRSSEDEDGDYVSRKRRFSFLTARGL